MRLGGYGSAILLLAVAVLGNQVLDGEGWVWPWAAAAVAMALATAGWDHWRGRPQPVGTLRLTDPRGEPPRLEQVSLAQLGVGESRFAAFLDRPAPHIARPIDALLAEVLATLPDREGRRGQLVVQGERLAGATHALAHAIRTGLPSWKVVAFADEQEMALSVMVERAATWVKLGSGVVVWLDAISLKHLGQLTEPLLAGLPTGGVER